MVGPLDNLDTHSINAKFGIGFGCILLCKGNAMSGMDGMLYLMNIPYLKKQNEVGFLVGT